MPEIILVNPSKRPSKRRKSNPSPAQKRARAKFAAMSRARAKGAKTMSNPKRRRKNPAKRAVARTHKRPVARRNPARRVARRRRNPIGMNYSGKATSLITPALIGAVGAAGVNTVYGYLASMLPASLNTGYGIYLSRAALSLGLAAVAGHGGSKKAAILQAAEGSLTVCLHDAIVAVSAGAGMSLSGMRGMSAYVRGRLPAGGATGRPQQLGAHLGAHTAAHQASAQANRAMLRGVRQSGMRF